MLALAAAITATFSPSHPTVGDRITVVFDRAPVVLDRRDDIEIIEQKQNRVVLRTFDAHPLALSGVAGAIAFRNLVLPIHSVLKEHDDLTPAWSYGYGELDTNSGKLAWFKPLPAFESNVWQGGKQLPDAKLDFTSLTENGGHPGEKNAVVRRVMALGISGNV